MNSLNAAIIGCGRIAGGFESEENRIHPCTHAGMYKSNSNIKMIAASDIDKKTLYKFGEKWSIDNLFNDYNNIFNEHNIDIVSLTTPSELHFEQLMELFKYPVKFIFCEKPLCSSVFEADELFKSAERTNIKIGVNFTRRWYPVYLKAKEIIESGMIGNIIRLDSHCYPGLLYMGSHLIDAILFLTNGKPEKVSAVLTDNNENNTANKDPGAVGNIYFKEGFTAGFNVLSGKKYMFFEINIIGSKGRILITDYDRSLYLQQSEQSHIYTDRNELSNMKRIPVSKKSPYLTIISEINDAITKSSNFSSTIHNAKTGLEVITGAHISSRNKGAIISLSEIDRKKPLNSQDIIK